MQAVESQYHSLIRMYFPESEWGRASSIAMAECPRGGCQADMGMMDCGQGARPAKALGLFKILDVCFDPSLNSDSIFKPEEWARVMDPNTNTWMASRIFARWGWRAWDTCEGLGICAYHGRPVPHPRGMMAASEAQGSPADPWPVVFAGAAVAAALIALDRHNSGARV